MAQTLIPGRQIKDGSVQRVDLDTTTTGSAVVAKLVQGTNITLSATGADSGTGDVTINVSSGFDTAARSASINFIINGNGSVLTTGSKGYLEVPFAFSITGWTITGDQSGSAVVDVKRSTYSAFPTTSSIAGSDLPTLSSAQKNQNLTLSSWTITLAAGDILEYNVNSATTVTRLTISLRGTKT